MKQFLIIPDRSHMQECLELAKKYGLGFEYNDFFLPTVLDDEKRVAEIIADYKQYSLPEYSTVHGDFFDVIPFSVDKKIREIAALRIEQSIQAAKSIGAKAVVFHTNYNPFLNTESYISEWIETNVTFWSKVLETHSDIQIYLENMFDTHPDILEGLSEKLSVYDNFGLCLDYAHAFLSKVRPEIWAERLGKYVKHIHINDNDGISDLHLAWGAGSIPCDVFYECYNDYIQNATILIETSSIENIVNSLKRLEEDGFLGSD